MTTYIVSSDPNTKPLALKMPTPAGSDDVVISEHDKYNIRLVIDSVIHQHITAPNAKKFLLSYADVTDLYKYCRDVLKKRWPAAEKRIQKEGDWLWYLYCVDIGDYNAKPPSS